MAAKQRQIRSAKLANGREIMRPIISSDIMGNRNVEVVPVGAWVEPVYGESQPDAVLAAKLEEEKIKKINYEKENQLRSFRRQVKKRVSHASQVKRQQQIQQAEKAFELERKVIQQSCEMGTSTRKDTCSLRNDELEHAIRLRLLKKYGEDLDEWETDRHQESSHEKDSLKVSNKARQQLVSKKVSPRSSHSSEVKTLGGQQNATKVNKDIQSPIVTTLVAPDVPPASSKGYKKDPDYSDIDENNDDKECDEEEDDEDDHNDDDDDDDFSSGDGDENNNQFGGTRNPTVQFADNKQVKKPRRIKKSASFKRPTSAQLAALLSQFTENEALARQKRQQAAISRRIFMDREREAVRENLRRQEHRKRITSLKKEKEAYRQELEALAQKEVEVSMRDNDTTDENYYEEDEELRKRLEAVHFQEMVEKRRQDLRKSREMERYLDALRHKLVEKARRLGISLPALCACGEIWDTHPETCANNCFFYKNNRAYARALQSLLASTEVM